MSGQLNCGALPGDQYWHRDCITLNQRLHEGFAEDAPALLAKPLRDDTCCIRCDRQFSCGADELIERQLPSGYRSAQLVKKLLVVDQQRQIGA